MYPAERLGLDFTNDDLPDFLTVNGASLSRHGSEYGNTTNGVIWFGLWELYTSGLRSKSNCLIRGDGNFTAGDDSIEDQFADTLIATWEGDSATLTRQSLCEWTGTSDTQAAIVKLFYDSGSEFNNYGWALQIVWQSQISEFENTPGTGLGIRENVPNGSGQGRPEGEYINAGGFDFTPAESGATVIEA